MNYCITLLSLRLQCHLRLESVLCDGLLGSVAGVQNRTTTGSLPFPTTGARIRYGPTFRLGAPNSSGGISNPASLIHGARTGPQNGKWDFLATVDSFNYPSVVFIPRKPKQNHPLPLPTGT